MRHLVIAFTLAFASQFVAAAPEAGECAVDSTATSESAWTKGSRRDYPEPGAGFSVGFQSRSGFGTVYIFDAEISDWKEGVVDPRLTDMIREVIAGVQELERRGRYSDLKIGNPSIGKLFCRDFVMLTLSGKLDGKPVQSTAAVAVRQGKVHKVRATFFSDPPEGVESATGLLVREAVSSGVLQ